MEESITIAKTEPQQSLKFYNHRDGSDEGLFLVESYTGGVNQVDMITGRKVIRDSLFESMPTNSSLMLCVASQFYLPWMNACFKFE